MSMLRSMFHMPRGMVTNLPQGKLDPFTSQIRFEPCL